MNKTIALPKELHEKPLLKSILACTYALALWIVPGLLVALIWQSSLGLGLSIVLTTVLGLIGGYGILLCGFMGHDGTHFNLHENRVVSSVMGILVTAPSVFYLLMGFTISHWNHHKFTNTDKDPDAKMFSQFKTFWSRLLFARPYTFYYYGLNTFRLALGKPLPFKYNFPLDAVTVRNLARLNILANGLAGGVHIYLLFNYPIFWAGVAFVRVCGVFVSGLSPYIEHTGTGLGRGHDTRTSVARWWDIVLLGNNYHLEHHLYPTIPCYNLKRTHLYLKQQGYYDVERHLTHGVFPTYRFTLASAPYPCFEESRAAG